MDWHWIQKHSIAFKKFGSALARNIYLDNRYHTDAETGDADSAVLDNYNIDYRNIRGRYC